MSLLKTISITSLLLTTLFVFDISTVVYASASEENAVGQREFTDEMITEALGVDGDANGIRDDVEAHIQSFYKERPNVKQRALDYVYFIQQQIEHVNDREKVLKIYTNSLTNLNCLRNAISNPAHEHKVHEALNSFIFNTDARIDISMRLKEHLKSYSHIGAQTSYECVNGELLTK